MTDLNLNFDLHKDQFAIYNAQERFVAAACGRRFGKSHVAVVKCLTSGAQEHNALGYDLTGKPIWYIAPTWKQGMDSVWDKFHNLGKDLIAGSREKDGVIKLINGCSISIKGSDRPDTLRGAGLRGAVLDEYASMKPEVWDQIISPALSDVKGWGLFIGTPHFTAPHFRELWERAREQEDWAAFTFDSTRNPYVDAEAEITRMRGAGIPEAVIRQEMYASFNAMGNKDLDPSKLVKVTKQPFTGQTFITVDPAGFAAEGKGLVSSSRDEHAICVTVVAPQGWYIQDIIHGRWGVRDTALKIIAACAKYRPRALGIEKGSLKNAMMPYLEDYQRQLGVYPNIVPLTHGGQHKTERIMWALQGRLEAGRVYCQVADWNQALVDQMYDFPNKYAHDDLIDALAYTQQIADSPFVGDIVLQEEDIILDATAGY